MKQKILLILICVLITTFVCGCANESADKADTTGACELVSEVAAEDTQDSSHPESQISEEGKSAAGIDSQPSDEEKSSEASQSTHWDTTEETYEVYTEPQIDFSDLE